MRRTLAPLRLGIVGLGRAAAQMLPSIAAHPHVVLAAGADPSPDARARFSADFAAPAFEDAQSLCARGEVDAIYVATPHEQHAGGRGGRRGARQARLRPEGPDPQLEERQLGPDRQRRNSTPCGSSTTGTARARAEDSRLDARIESFELAHRMQMRAPDAFDLTRETPATQRLYGIDQQGDRGVRPAVPARPTARRARRALRAALPHDRRLSAVGPAQRPQGRAREKRAGHRPPHRRPVADLKARGLLADTLVIWGGEFGRTPAAEGTNGRDHHPYGFTMWLAGGGVRGGMAHGATDELAGTPSRSGSTSTTCTPPSCTCWGSTTNS